MNHRCLFSRLVAVLGIAATSIGAQFGPDANTLLLASFDEQTTRADYAMGLSLFAGNGATLTDGYYGKAIDLRRRGLTKDFWDTCADYTPRYDAWGFHSRGNVDPWQGTFECWFKPADPRKPKLLWSYNFLNAELCNSVKHPENPERYSGFGLTLHMYGLKYFFPTVAGKAFLGELNFKDIEGFARYLDPAQWHHFAMTWSQGALVVHLDGRPLLSFDMTDQLGLVLVANPTRFLSMSDCVIDELRISNVVRYEGRFEPQWQGGSRPDYAFPGHPKVTVHAHRTMPAAEPAVPPAPRKGSIARVSLGEYLLQFDKQTGTLVDFQVGRSKGMPASHGLILHSGLDRVPLQPVGLDNFWSNEEHLVFNQRFEQNVRASHLLREVDGVLVWETTLSNEGDEEAWLEPLLSLPVPLREVEEFFDGIEPRTMLHLPRHHDEYCYTLPFVAAAGNGEFFGVGMDPRIDLSDIVNEWIPDRQSGVLRQGTKVALAPKESFTYRFVIVRGEGGFATLDAIAKFHAQFPDLYHLRPDVPVYSYLPATQYYMADKHVDMKRLGYAGAFWGHGPGRDKGDEYGRPDWWNNPKFDGKPGFRDYTKRIQRMWGSPANLREYITAFFRQSYDNFYPVRRFHTCPDVTPIYIAQELWPGYVANEDPLCFGQYYVPNWNWWIVNEYHTPIGAHFRETTRQFFRQTKGYCPGFINDMSHAGALYRHNDPIAKRTPGRSFSRDLGPFVRKALGRKQRYEVLNEFVDSGHRATVWSDGGSFSHTLGAYSSGMAIEGAGLYKDLTGSGDYVVPARNLVGEKPFSAMTHLNDDWIGYYLDAKEFTPATLRDYYRYCGSQLALYGIENGITLDPSSYMYGRQKELELAPILVESTVLGRQVVHAARVADSLWVRRAGRELDTFLVVGNNQPKPVQTDGTVYRRYFGGAPVFVEYYGGKTVHRIEEKTVTMKDVAVQPRDVAAFKAAAMLQTKGGAAVTSRLAGDGIQLRLDLSIRARSGDELTLSSFAPLYEIAEVTLDGDTISYDPRIPILIRQADTEVKVVYRNRAIAFSAAEWKNVELIKDGKVNFCLVADKGVSFVVDTDRPKTTHRFGFEHGTANLLNEFLEEYDSEDGIPGNLGYAEFKDAPPKDYPGWTVVLKEDPVVPAGRVRIENASRTITVEGATQGEMRRAMVVFMRLVDRKYPHVGRFFPFRYRKQFYVADKPVPIEKWVVRKPTAEFFKTIEDPKFLVKPILRREYESLYANDNMDFAGKYEMRWSPYLFEPTYGDDYVYGYSGPGTGETRAQLDNEVEPLDE